MDDASIGRDRLTGSSPPDRSSSRVSRRSVVIVSACSAVQDAPSPPASSLPRAQSTAPRTSVHASPSPRDRGPRGGARRHRGARRTRGASLARPPLSPSTITTSAMNDRLGPFIAARGRNRGSPPLHPSRSRPAHPRHPPPRSPPSRRTPRAPVPPRAPSPSPPPPSATRRIPPPRRRIPPWRRSSPRASSSSASAWTPTPSAPRPRTAP